MPITKTALLVERIITDLPEQGRIVMSWVVRHDDLYVDELTFGEMLEVLLANLSPDGKTAPCYMRSSDQRRKYEQWRNGIREPTYVSRVVVPRIAFTGVKQEP